MLARGRSVTPAGADTSAALGLPVGRAAQWGRGLLLRVSINKDPEGSPAQWPKQAGDPLEPHSTLPYFRRPPAV